jgi:hypothetical protein
MGLDVGRLVKHLRSGAVPEVALDGGAADDLARREAGWFTAGEDWVSFPQGGAWLSYRTVRRLSAGITTGYAWAADFLAADARRLGTAGLRASPGWRKIMERPSGRNRPRRPGQGRRRRRRG